MHVSLTFCSTYLGCIFLILLGTLSTFARTSELAPEAPYECKAPCKLFQIVWTGDVCLTEQGQGSRVLEKEGLDFPFEHLRSLLSADYVIGNSEGPITKRREAYGEQRWTYNMNPKAAAVLRAANFSALSAANNHAFDRGPAGFFDSRRLLQKAGMTVFGAGSSEHIAYRPLMIESPWGKVGVVALFHNIGRGARLPARLKAIVDLPGSAWLTKGSVRRAAKQARKLGARWIVGFVHWGTNYRDVLGGQVRAAGYFADAGYDLVIGHGPHVPQRVERVGKTWVLYSLGNFVFTTEGRFEKLNADGHGLLARTYLGPAGFEGIELTCLAINNRHSDINYQPRVCTSEEQQRVFTSLGPDVHVHNGLGRIRLATPTDAPAEGVSLLAPASRRAAVRRRRRTAFTSSSQHAAPKANTLPKGVSLVTPNAVRRRRRTHSRSM